MTGDDVGPEAGEGAPAFDRAYWEDRWRASGEASPAGTDGPAPNPHLITEIGDLSPGTALDAGCGDGAAALWLASQGWRVTGADISGTALRAAATRATDAGLSDRVSWVEADLTTWEPAEPLDLVLTAYAHPAMPQLAFYGRVASWVAPGGTLLIIGHLHEHAHDAAHAGPAGHAHDAEHGPPVEATVTLPDILAELSRPAWDVVTAEEHRRTAPAHGGAARTLPDVVVRAVRRH